MRRIWRAELPGVQEYAYPADRETGLGAGGGAVPLFLFEAMNQTIAP